MATDQRTVDVILARLEGAGVATAKKMFGEYGLYLNDKIIGVICDNQLFIKPTKAGQAFIGEPKEARPYPSAKPSFLIDGELWDDADWLCDLARITHDELPAPKPKKKK